MRLQTLANDRCEACEERAVAAVLQPYAGRAEHGSVVDLIFVAVRAVMLPADYRNSSNCLWAIRLMIVRPFLPYRQKDTGCRWVRHGVTYALAYVLAIRYDLDALDGIPSCLLVSTVCGVT